MAKMTKRVLAMCMALLLSVSMMTVPAFAEGNGNTGTGQTQAKIHLDGDNIGNNGDSVDLFVGENKYEGKVQGGNLNVEMNTTDNHFNFGKEESLEITYINNTTGETGTIILSHKEGNGGTENDKGKNNFNGSVAKTPATTEPPAIEPPATEPPATEPPATEPPATEPPVTEPPATEPPASEPSATEPPASEPSATEPSETNPAETPSQPTQAPTQPNAGNNGGNNGGNNTVILILIGAVLVVGGVLIALILTGKIGGSKKEEK